MPLTQHLVELLPPKHLLPNQFPSPVVATPGNGPPLAADGQDPCKDSQDNKALASLLTGKELALLEEGALDVEQKVM